MSALDVDMTLLIGSQAELSLAPQISNHTLYFWTTDCPQTPSKSCNLKEFFKYRCIFFKEQLYVFWSFLTLVKCKQKFWVAISRWSPQLHYLSHDSYRKMGRYSIHKTLFKKLYYFSWGGNLNFIAVYLIKANIICIRSFHKILLSNFATSEGEKTV